MAARSTDTATIHAIVTCANRKSRPVPDYLRLAQVSGADDAKRVGEWIARLDGAGALGVARPARELYAGEHWTIAGNLPERAEIGESVQLWACSAGYGLIRASAPIHPYAATFTAGHPDTVPGEPSAWWDALGRWKGPQPGAPRTIAELADASTEAVFLVMLSPPYLRACRDDIQAAISNLPHPDRFLLISAGTRPSADTGDILLPADARLQSCLGGTRQSLNVRIGKRLLERGIRDRATAVGYLSRLLEEQPPMARFDRAKLSDAEVVSMILGGLARAPGASASRLLRELRDSGYACEQGRFGQLHAKLTASK